MEAKRSCKSPKRIHRHQQRVGGKNAYVSYGGCRHAIEAFLPGALPDCLDGYITKFAIQMHSGRAVGAAAKAKQ